MKNLRYICLGLLATLMAVSATAQTDQAENKKKKEIVLPADEPGSAFKFLLQKREWAKHFDDKKFGDHLFLETGAGLSTNFGHSLSSGVFGASGNISVGDWITPEHGVRLGFEAKVNKTASDKAKTFGFSLDYLMNISAIASPTYEEAKRFEVYGIAGLDIFHAKTANGFGVHLGARGQWNMTDYTYLYLEPRVGVYTAKAASHFDNVYGYRPGASLRFGVGYRMREASLRHSTADDDFSFRINDEWFFQAMVGPGFLVHTKPNHWKEQMGGRLQLALGKWFTPTIGLRLSGNVSAYDQGKNASATKGGGVGLELIWNMHNTFGGVRSDRSYWVNGLFGPSFNYTKSSSHKAESSFGVGIGLQPNFRVSDHISLFIEPRIDIYEKSYSREFTTEHDWRMIANLLAGVSFNQGATHYNVRERNAEFPRHFYDEWFIQAGAGLQFIYDQERLVNPSHSRPVVGGAVGKWFTPLSGARVWANAGQLEYINSKYNGFARMYSIAFGLDYLFNITNAIFGYDPDHHFELSASAGLNLASRPKHTSSVFGGNLGLKAQYNVNRMWGLYVEPQLRLNGPALVPNTNMKDVKADLIASLMAGVHVNMRKYDAEPARQAFNEDGHTYFYTFGAGIMTHGKKKRFKEFGEFGRIGVGEWFTPVSAWRATGALTYFGHIKVRGKDRQYAKGKLNLDYMVDASALNYGYNPDRFFSFRPFLGGGVGASYYKSNPSLDWELHGGAQFAFRLSSHVEAFLEGQLAYEWHNKHGNEFSSRLNHWEPMAQLGVNYNFRRRGTTSSTDNADAEPRQFVSLRLGPGLSTENFTLKSRRLNFGGDISYGYWLNYKHGLMAGVSHEVQQRIKNSKRGSTMSLTAIHVDYMLNLISIFTNEPNDEVFRFNGYVGVLGGMGSRKGFETTYALGLEGGLQFGLRVARNFEVFLEPNAQLWSKKIHENPTNHPFEAEGHLMIGTKYCF